MCVDVCYACVYLYVCAGSQYRVDFLPWDTEYFGKPLCRWSLRLFWLSHYTIQTLQEKGRDPEPLSLATGGEGFTGEMLEYVLSERSRLPSTEMWCEAGEEPGQRHSRQRHPWKQRPEVGRCLACLGNRKESCEEGAERGWGVVRLERWAGATAHGGP